MKEFLDEDVDLGLGTRALVTGVRIPPPLKGLWLWGHKVSKPLSAGMCIPATVSRGLKTTLGHACK